MYQQHPAYATPLRGLAESMRQHLAMWFSPGLLQVRGHTCHVVQPRAAAGEGPHLPCGSAQGCWATTVTAIAAEIVLLRLLLFLRLLLPFLLALLLLPLLPLLLPLLLLLLLLLLLPLLLQLQHISLESSPAALLLLLLLPLLLLLLPLLLQLQRISWESSPAALLEKVSRSEAVHEVRGWEDMRCVMEEGAGGGEQGGR